MWLKYGVSLSGQLLSVDDVPQGKTNLYCLYCGGSLTAKKGEVNKHHFAHTKETCKMVITRIKYKSFPGLPLYDNFNVQLTGKQLEQIKVLWKSYGAHNYPIPKDLITMQLILKKIFNLIENKEYEFTDLGKIPVGVLGLRSFNQVQEPLILAELARLEKSARLGNYLGIDERVADWRIYQAQLKRILLNYLYFLEIKVDGNLLYKIGITQRAIEERIGEVVYDLKNYYSDIAVNLLGLWQHRGNVELYFKHRYKQFNYPIGTLTEYFQFPQIKPVLRDLFDMEPKVLGEVERELLKDRAIATSRN